MLSELKQYWMIRCRKSSKRQSIYFGPYGAFRPYVLVEISNDKIVNNDLIKEIIRASFSCIEVKGVNYKKYFGLDECDTFEFDYSKCYINSQTHDMQFEKFEKVTV